MLARLCKKDISFLGSAVSRNRRVKAIHASSKVMICQIITGLNPGGAERMLYRLMKVYQETQPNQQHVVISLTGLGKVGEQLRVLGIPVYTLELGAIKRVPSAIYQLFKLLRTLKPDVIQTWMYHADLVGGVVARLAGFKNIIWGIRTTDIMRCGAKRTQLICLLCAKLSYFIPKQVVCVADAAKSQHATIGYDPRKLCTVHNGFDLSLLQTTKHARSDFRAELGISDNTLLIGMVARFDIKTKDPLNFIQAAKRVVETHSTARFVMIGKNCDAQNQVLLNWLRAASLIEHFFLLGERHDVPACMTGLDIFCLSSRTEGLPNALGEAMAMRKLCIATDVGDAALLLGESGCIVPKGDSEAMAGAICQYISLSSEERTQLEEKAHARIVSGFSMTKASEGFLRVYETCQAE